MNNYNILLASNEIAPSVLCSAVSIMWQWNTLLNGETLIGKHFNRPPDWSYGSSYDYYKAPLEDPFAITEPAKSNPRPVARSIEKQIRQFGNDGRYFVRSINQKFVERSNDAEKISRVKKYPRKLQKVQEVSPDSGDIITGVKGYETGVKDKAHRRQDSGPFNKFRSWCRSWRSSKLTDESEFKQTAEELFSKESFWKELGSYLGTSRGSVLFLQSRTRAEMAQNLRKDISYLSSREDVVLRLVNLLISEKNWVKECPSRTFHYKLHRPAIDAALN